MYYLFELRDSDGSDCSVYDAIVETYSAEKAREMAGVLLEVLYPRSEPDSDWGCYHPCDCECEHSLCEREDEPDTWNERGICELCADRWECSHGGAILSGIWEGDIKRCYKTFEAAKEAGSSWHGTVSIDAEGNVTA